MSTDPVCGMEVHETLAPVTAEYDGRTFHFCSTRCFGKFQDNPTAYVQKDSQQSTARAA